MSYLPRHESHRKKKSKAPWFLITVILGISALVFTQERKIRLFFSGDLKQKIERQREKIFDSLEKSELTEVYTRDYLTYATDLFDKEPLDPQAHFFKAEAYYFELLLSGARFDSFSLTQYIRRPIQALFGENEKTKLDSENMYENALRASAIQKDFTYSSMNRFLLFLGETLRNKKSPQARFKDYKDISLDDMHKSYHHIYIWLMFYTSVRTGNVEALNELLAKNSEEGFTGKLLLTERETDFLRGLCHYYSRDYVLSLNHLRKVKTNDMDSITKNAILAEANIFYLQNLPQKGIDLLLLSYKSNQDTEDFFLDTLRKWAKEKPELKIEIPNTKKEEETSDEEWE